MDKFIEFISQKSSHKKSYGALSFEKYCQAGHKGLARKKR
jgi:hypothetical protein